MTDPTSKPIASHHQEAVDKAKHDAAVAAINGVDTNPDKNPNRLAKAAIVVGAVANGGCNIL
jgi:hypothetical protein